MQKSAHSLRRLDCSTIARRKANALATRIRKAEQVKALQEKLGLFLQRCLGDRSPRAHRLRLALHSCKHPTKVAHGHVDVHDLLVLIANWPTTTLDLNTLTLALRTLDAEDRQWIKEDDRQLALPLQ